MKKIVVTGHSDASFNADKNVASYAYLIESEGMRMTRSGRINKSPIKSSSHAEFKAFIACIEDMINLFDKNFDISFYTDSQDIISIMSIDKRKITKFRLKTLVGYRSRVFYLIKGRNISLSVNHVQSHTGKSDPHSIRNEMCDSLANECLKSLLSSLNNDRSISKRSKSSARVARGKNRGKFKKKQKNQGSRV